MKDLTIIIPVHEYNETVKKYLDNALESIRRQKVSEVFYTVIVTPDEIADQILFPDDMHVMVLHNNSGKYDYQSQVNFALNFVKSKYFTVLEFDDELSNTYVKNVNEYVNSYPDIDVFLSLIIEKNEKGNGIKFTNETVWAQQFVGENGEIGYLNTDGLKQYTDFKLSGAVINREKFISIGGYKSNIKLTFMLEFLLRSLNMGLKIYTIPKLIYSHLATRDGSLFDTYGKTMTTPEKKYWFDTAYKEYNFTKDRIVENPIFN